MISDEIIQLFFTFLMVLVSVEIPPQINIATGHMISVEIIQPYFIDIGLSRDPTASSIRFEESNELSITLTAISKDHVIDFS